MNLHFGIGQQIHMQKKQWTQYGAGFDSHRDGEEVDIAVNSNYTVK